MYDWKKMEEKIFAWEKTAGGERFSRSNRHINIDHGFRRKSYVGAFGNRPFLEA